MSISEVRTARGSVSRSREMAQAHGGEGIADERGRDVDAGSCVVGGKCYVAYGRRPVEVSACRLLSTTYHLLSTTYHLPPTVRRIRAHPRLSAVSGPQPSHFRPEPNHFHPEPSHFQPKTNHFQPKSNHFRAKSNHFAILLMFYVNARPPKILVSRVRGRLNLKPYWRPRRPEIIGTKADESAMKMEQTGKKVERKWKETGKKVERKRPFSRS